ncbi:MAG: biopolymer transporter ExbD, partial [Myxococcota bacterium]
LASTAGESTAVPRDGDAYDLAQLRELLQQRRRLEPNRQDIVIAPEDGVRYEEVVRAMDAVMGEGFEQMSLGDGAALL